MNRAFKVIQGHPYWCRQESRTVRCCNVQYADVISETCEDMATTKQQIRRFQPPYSGLKMPRQETPSNIYKWFILPETSVIELYFCCWQYGSTFISFYL